MKPRIGGPKYHNRAASRKKRAPREITEAIIKTAKFRSMTPEVMVMTL